jgi:cysteine dioxygenase
MATWVDVSFDCLEGCPINHCDYYAHLFPDPTKTAAEERPSFDGVEVAAPATPSLCPMTDKLSLTLQSTSANQSRSASPKSTANTSPAYSPRAMSLLSPAEQQEKLILARFTPQPHLPSLAALSCALDKVFIFYPDAKTQWPERKRCIEVLLKNVTVSAQDLRTYAHCSRKFPYTRNLIATDQQQYTILLLCWNADMESKIHNHPCDGCFVKSVRGQIKETKYVEADKLPGACEGGRTCVDVPGAQGDGPKRLAVISEVILSPGEVTYMDDFIGYHKVGNAAPPSATEHDEDNDEDVAITLHVYTPPYHTCKVWASPDNADEFFTGTVCSYSEYGRVVCDSEKDCPKGRDCCHYYI